MKKETILSSSEIRTKEYYNDIPVTYCKHCLSLAVTTSGDIEFCEKCGSTSTEEASIEKWEELYQLKYGHKYIE